MTQEIVDAVKMLEQEKGIAADTLMDALQDALLSAYKKTPARPSTRRSNSITAPRTSASSSSWFPTTWRSACWTSSSRSRSRPAEAGQAAEPIPEIEISRPVVDPETGERREVEEPEVELGRLEPYMDQIKTQDVTPEDFGRIAAQTAKQVILQRIRGGRAGHDVRGVQGPRRRAGHRDHPAVRQPLHAGPASRASRGPPAALGAGLQRTLRPWHAREGGDHRRLGGHQARASWCRAATRADQEALRARGPEIADKLVEITGVAREPGWRSKIAVVSHADGVDPVGACVGPRGSRVRMVVSELRGEKIDIIPYNDEPARRRQGCPRRAFVRCSSTMRPRRRP